MISFLFFPQSNGKENRKASSDPDFDRDTNTRNSCQPNDVVKKSVKKVSAPVVTKGKVKRISNKEKKESKELSEDENEAPPKKPRKQTAGSSPNEKQTSAKKSFFKPTNPFARKRHQVEKAGE